MTKTFWSAGACVAALALVLGSGVASAQQKATDAPKAAAPKAPAKKAATNPCTSLKDEAACTANAECGWTKETVTKKGQKRAAYCHKKPTTAKKAEPKAPAKAAAPAPKAPAAPAADKKQ